MTNLEERANTITHGIGLCLSIIGFFILIKQTSWQENPWLMGSALVYGLTTIVLYAASTVYHSLPLGKSKQLLQRIDHAAIYLFIAGTYTPFTLGPLRNQAYWGWALFIFIWLFGIIGIFIKLLFMGRLKKLSLVSYVGMGWAAVIAIKPLYDTLSINGLYWLFGGGLCYSIGVIFYKLERLPLSHAIWHVFVIAGSFCHYICIFLYIY